MRMNNEIKAEAFREAARQLRNLMCHPSHRDTLAMAVEHLERQANLMMMGKPQQRREKEKAE